MTDATGGAAPLAATAAHTETDQAAAAKPLTAADFEAMLAAHLPKVVNAAVTSHTKRLEKDFAARIAALTPAQQKAADAADDAGAGAGASDDAAPAAKPAGQQAAATAQQPDPRIAALEAKLAKLARDNEKAQQQAAAERRLRQEEQGHEQIRAALRGKVHAGLEDDVLDSWRARKNVVIGDDGVTRIRFGSQDEPEDGLDIPAAVAAFLKTDKAKFYLPPPNGAGARVGARPPFAGSGATKGASTVAANFEAKFGKPLGEALKD